MRINSRSQSQGPDRIDKVSVILRGAAVFRVDALAWQLWLADGRSAGSSPSRSDALRALVLHPAEYAQISVSYHRCAKCEKVFGAPWCWEHEGRYMEPYSQLEPMKP